MERLPALLLLLWLCSTFFVGIHLFVGGFLLVRVEVNRSSSCADALLPAASSRPDFCVGEARFRRAVLLVVDALRLDFALVRGGSAPFHDRLPVLQEVTSSRPERARLFAFRADPPTTTMQRIKGFTTGSLPTFVDVGNNFASSAILEDNLVRQLARAGKRVVFMGDDTWESLFPNQFHRSLPFPSFNVKDLHTVDDGILKHLYPTMEGSDWDVLIAHFLGVDHCGHRFGPDHPAMADKLAQMDRVIRSVMGRLQNDTLLVVMGDHGMTDTGDHGGESLKETDAALFLYSPSPVFPAALSQAEPEVVLQTDLVPTLALLLGVPIPYSSIGQVILPLFPQESETAGAQGHLSQLEALWVNAKQVNRFLETYSYVARDIPRESLFVLRDKFAALWNEYSGAAKGGRAASPALVAALQRYLTAVRDVCQATWAKFHPLKMASGIAILATACAVCFAVSEVSAGAGDSVAPRVPLATGAVAAAGVAAGQLASQGYVDAAWCLGAAVLSSQLTFLWGLRRSGGKGGAPARGGDPRHGAGRSLPRAVFSVPLLALALRCASLLSDSYVIAEGRVATFLLLSLGLYIPLRLNWEGLLLPSSPDCQKASGLLLPPSSPPPPSAARRESLVLLAGLGVLVASLYLSLFLHNCREEQGACNPSPLLVPLARVQDSSLRNVRYVLSVLSLSACAYGLRCWLRHYGNLNGPGAAVFAARWPLPLASLCTGLYWAVSSTPERSFRGFAELIALALVVLPRTAFAFLVLGTTLLWLNPLTVFLKPRQVPGQGKGPAPLPRYRASTALSPEAELHHLIPQLYQRMRRSLEDGESPGDSEGDGRPAVEAYGLGTVYSAPVVLLSGLLGSGLLLLHPEGMALAFLLLLVEGVALLHLHASFVKLTSLHGARQGDFSVPWLSVLLWDLAATQFFHATGHLPTFPSIQWGAAFVGFPQGHVGTLLPGSLVALNTFASHILFAVGCPLLLFWPLVCEIRAPQRGYGSSERDAVMEMRLRERPREFSAALLQLAARCFCVKGAQVLASALAAAILRRHLMVWKVFAPKLIFEAAGFVLASVFTLIGCALVLRVDFADQGTKGSDFREEPMKYILKGGDGTGHDVHFNGGVQLGLGGT